MGGEVEGMDGGHTTSDGLAVDAFVFLLPRFDFFLPMAFVPSRIREEGEGVN